MLPNLGWAQSTCHTGPSWLGGEGGGGEGGREERREEGMEGKKEGEEGSHKLGENRRRKSKE